MFYFRDTTHSFITAFNPATGAYVRSGILQNGQDTGIDPFMASFPHLIDVGIMGHCLHGQTGLCVKAGIGCYQDGLHISKPNMSLDDFRRIAVQCRHRTMQFALGGRGDPDQHEQFEDILITCRENDIVPNFTTSGFGLTKHHSALCAKYCGAVAVSWYRSSYTLRAIEYLLGDGVKTNIHYVLSRHSIDEALERLECNGFPSGINAVIFLLHKPVGLGEEADILEGNDPRVLRFFEAIDRGGFPYKIGVDSCTVPGLIAHCHHLNESSVDSCEGGRFSCYISSDLDMTPCSFDSSKKYSVSLRKMTIDQAWNSTPFSLFREKLQHQCPSCRQRTTCYGGCPLLPQIVLCDRPERTK